MWWSTLSLANETVALTILISRPTHTPSVTGAFHLLREKWYSGSFGGQWTISSRPHLLKLSKVVHNDLFSRVLDSPSLMIFSSAQAKSWKTCWVGPQPIVSLNVRRSRFRLLWSIKPSRGPVVLLLLRLIGDSEGLGRTCKANSHSEATFASTEGWEWFAIKNPKSHHSWNR